MNMFRGLSTSVALSALLLGWAGAQGGAAGSAGCSSSELFAAGDPGHLIGTTDAAKLDPRIVADDVGWLGKEWFGRYVKSWIPQRDAAIFIVDLFQPTLAQVALNEERPASLDAWYSHGDLVLLHTMALIEGSGQFKYVSGSYSQPVYEHENGKRLYVRTVDLNANRSGNADAFDIGSLAERLQVAYQQLNNAAVIERPLNAVVNMSFSIISCPFVNGYNEVIRRSGKFVAVVNYEKALLGQFGDLRELDPEVLRELQRQRNLFVNSSPLDTASAPGQLAQQLRESGVLDRFLFPKGDYFPPLQWQNGGLILPKIELSPGSTRAPRIPTDVRQQVDILNQAREQISRLQSRPGLSGSAQQDARRLLQELYQLEQVILPPASPVQLSGSALTRALQYFDMQLTGGSALVNAVANLRQHLRTDEMTAQRRVLVAAAGNLGVPVPTLPAALPEVLSVGGTVPGGMKRAPWSNGAEVLHRGEWFKLPVTRQYFETLRTTAAYVDALRYSGTSFAAPNVSVFIAMDLMRGTPMCVQSEPLPNTAVLLTAFHSQKKNPASLFGTGYPGVLFYNALSSCRGAGGIP